jgi:hypothetical protein
VTTEPISELAPRNPAKDWPKPDPEPIPMAMQWRRDRFEKSRAEGWASAIYCVKCGSLKVDTLFPNRLWCMEPGCANSVPLDPARFAIIGGIGDTSGATCL